MKNVLEYKKKTAQDYVSAAAGYKENNFTDEDREKLTQKAKYFEDYRQRPNAVWL